MAATAAMITQLRRMIAEPLDNQHLTYLDTDLSSYIETYPTLDADGNEPDDTDWVATYDLHAAAAAIWEEKATGKADYFDFSADGNTSSRSQVFAQYMKMARFHNARRQPGTIKVVVTPRPVVEWIGNLAEENI
jgi:hypothetical protein